MSLIEDLTGTIPDLPTVALFEDNGIQTTITRKRKTSKTNDAANKKKKKKSTGRETD